MGNQHSSNKGIASSSSSLCLRFGCLSDPSFYLEKNIILFFFDNTKFISESPKHLHSVNDLMNLVILCPEQITDLDSVLEEIILLDTPNKTDYIGLLELNFKKYIQMSIDRNLRYQLFCNHRDYSLVQNQHFEIIYSHIHDTFSALFQQTHSKDSILKVQNFLKSDPNIWSISPPVAAFFPTNGENTINCTKYLNGNYPRNIDYSTINLGNLCSNGQFLFWFLPPHPSNAVLVIFPIFNNGILMEPKNIEVLLDGVNSQSKMILNSQIVNIYGLSENDAAHSRRYLLSIDKLIFCNDYYNGETKSLSVPSVPYKVSDAVFKVNIEKGKISVFDVKDDTTIHVVNTANNSTLGNEIPTALNNKKSKIIVETNGSVLNFIKPIEEGKYLCKSYSLITGKHLRNEEFESPETIISSTIDSINYCRWCLTKTKDNQYFMKKVALQGGMNFHIFGLRCSYKYSNENETSKYRIFQKLYHHVLHYCASSIIPNYLICNSYQHFQSLIEFLETSFKFENPTIMNTLAIIISLNIPMFKNEMNHQEKILNLMNNLPCGLSFLLFFPNLTSFFSYNIDLALNTTITLISKADSKDNDYMLSYAFRQLEKYDFLAFIDFNQNNILSTIIPQDLQSTKDIKRSIISLLLIHQRVLIRNVTNFLKHDPYSTINFKVSVQEGGNPLNIIYDYASLIINHLSLAINKDLLTTKSENSKSSKQNKINSQNALPESLLYFLYTNFLNLLSDLSKYHVISQFMMSLLSVLLEQLLVTKVEDIEMQRVILSSIFSYGMFASTLIVGGNTTEFEERYSWLIRNNIHLLNTPIINYLESSSIEEFEDPTFNLFLNNELALDKIYQKYKPQFNRKLNESLKFIDKLAILAISKHIGCLEELFKLTDINFKGTIQLTTKFRKVLDQMMKIRNTFHKLSQEHKPTHDINIKCLMLIRMTADSFNYSEISPEDIQKLVTGSLTPQKIVKILNMQKNRVEITSLGFSFLKVVLNSKVDNIFAKIISHTMGKIETFDGLASIMHILRPSSNQKDEINSFFELALNYPEMRIVAFRFFKSIKSLSEIKSNILANILKTSAMTQLPPSLFALAFSLIDSDTLFSDELVKIHPLASTRLSLLGAFAKYSIIPLEIQNDLLNVLWTVKQNEIRQILKILFFAMDQIDASILQNLFLEMLVYIGNQFSTNSDISIAIEIIMFLRKIIEYGSITVSGILSNLMTCYHEENFEEIPIIGIVSVLGLQVENFHFIATINDSLYDKTADQYLVMSNSSNQEIYYKKQFDLKTPPRLTKIPAEQCIVVPEITITKFIYTEYISRILRACLVYSRIPCTLPICAQTFSHFCRFENYTNFIKPDLVDLLGSLITPFENINNTIKEINSLQSMKAIQDYSPIFGVLQSQGHYSYISPPISISAPDFNVTAKIPNENDFQGYFGIVSDTLEKRHTRYSIISFPKCVTFPQNQEIGQFNNCNNCITFNVLNNSKKIEVLGKLIEFPTGKQFKVIFMTQATMLDLNVNPLSSKTNNEIFDSSLPPTLIPTTTDKFDDDENDGLFNYPSFIKNFTGNQPLKPEIAQYSAIFNIAKPMSKAKKLRFYLIAPPNDQPISIGFADEASYSIIKHQIAGLYKKLANQWITLGLARITYQRPDLLIYYAFELFRAFCIPLELFDQTEFNLNRFPFALFTPAWESKKVFYLSIENDLKKALVSLISDRECFSIITSRIFELNHDKKIHLCALPSSNSVTILNTEKIIFAFPNSIIAFNDFNGYEKEICSLLRNANESVNFPYIRGKDINSNAPNSPEILSFDKKYDERDFTILNIDSSSNNWVFNTSFELMILYKNLVLADKKKELNVKVKSFLLDIFLLQSPFILPYIHQFLYFVQNMVISTPFDNEIEYLRRLVALAGFVKASPDPDEVFISFYKHEQELFCDQFIARFSMHFPEFFNSKIPLPRINTVTIPEVIIHPAALSNRFDFYYHVQQIHKFMNLNKNDKLNQTIMTNNSFGNSSFKTNPLAGIPFWHIFPFWYRIYKINNDSETNEDYLPPKTELIMNSVYKVTIYTDTAKIVFINRSHRFLNDLLLMVSRTLDFEDADMIFGRDILNNIFVNRGDTYLALVNGDSLSDYSNPWDEFIEFQIFDEKSPTRKSIVERSKSVEIEVSSIKTEFIHDMESFATKWLPQHTESLLRLFTLQDLKAQSFTPVYEIAHSSSLCAVFPENIICLCALLLHHFNYINEFHYNKVPEPFWNSTSDLIPFDKTCASFLKAIESEPCVSKNRQVIEINRKASQIFLTAGAGRKEDTVIYQLAKIINKYGFTKFRMEQTPFFVKFTNELAIDAGGPSNEILIEAINSAFHPSTQLFVQTINSGKTYFIPNPDAQEEINSVYSALGVILAIIIRTGALQNIPFAPFIWKYLAGEDILSSDIAEADEEFKTLLNHLNNGFIDNIKWTATTWDHKNVYNLSGGNDRQVYKEYINLYLQEYINFRIGLIKNQLQSIKNGFQANTGVDSHKFLCGKVLSWLAQGGGNVSVDNLKPVINFVGFSNDIESINQFWRVLEKFNNEQLQLLLKFITTLSRIPNRTIDQNFKIRVYRLECNNPNDALPTASTCFKKLYLPKYESDDIAYRKLLYAIQFCQTMENN